MTPGKAPQCRCLSGSPTLAPVPSCGAEWVRRSLLLAKTHNMESVHPPDGFRAAAR